MVLSEVNYQNLFRVLPKPRWLLRRTIAWNPGATRLYGWSEAEARLLNVRERIPQHLHSDEAAKVQALVRAEILAPYHTQRLTRNAAVVDVSVTATALVNEAGQPFAIATTEHPLAPE